MQRLADFDIALVAIGKGWRSGIQAQAKNDEKNFHEVLPAKMNNADYSIK
jgi:hypothetical protein